MKIWVITADDHNSYQIIGAAASQKMARKVSREHKEKFREHTNVHEVEMRVDE